MNNPSLQFVLAVAASAAFAPALGAQILSNGTGGGDFATGSTWTGGVAPTGSFQVVTGDSVTANSGLAYSSSNNSSVLGTLTVNTGASITMGRMNSGLVVNNSTINVAGGSLSLDRFATSTGSGGNIVNISAGTLTTRAANVITGSYYTFNVGGSGTFVAGGGVNTTLNLSTGGTVIFKNGAKKTSGAINWNGGGVIMSSGAVYNASEANAVFDGWKLNDANVLAFSSEPTKQTLTFGNIGTNSFPGLSSTQGVMSFNVYSATANDSDLLNFVSTSSLSLTDGVDLRIEGVSLGGVAADYLGQSYQLFHFDSGNYSNLAPTISSTIWNIGGEDYQIGWTNNLAIDGSLTIASITSTAIPEPSAFASLGGLAALAFASSRRRARR